MSKSIRAACIALAERVKQRAGTWLLEKLVGAAVPEDATEQELEELGTSAYVHPRPGDADE